MEKKNGRTDVVVIINFVLFVFTFLVTWITTSLLYGRADPFEVMIGIFVGPLLFILGVLLFILWKPDMSVINKSLPCISGVVFFCMPWIEPSDIPLHISMIVGILSCLTLIILTIRKVISRKSNIPY